MTRKDFLLISGAVAATKQRIETDNKLTPEEAVAQLRGVRRTAAHLADALLGEHGDRFDVSRFFDDCGFGGSDPVRSHNR